VIVYTGDGNQCDFTAEDC